MLSVIIGILALFGLGVLMFIASMMSTWIGYRIQHGEISLLRAIVETFGIITVMLGDILVMFFCLA